MENVSEPDAAANDPQQQPAAEEHGPARSVHVEGSTVTATLTITNSTPQSVQLVWLDFSGQEQVYNILQPGTTTEQGTFSTHAWRLLGEDGVLLLQYRGPSATLTVLPADQGGSIVDVGA